MNFHHDLNFDYVKSTCKLKIPITVSKSYARVRRVEEREKRGEGQGYVFRER